MGTDIRFGLHQQASPTSATTQNFTDSTGLGGATPVGALFFGSNAAVVDTERVSFNRYVGATDGSTHFAIASQSSDAQGAGATGKLGESARSIHVPTALSSTGLIEAAFSAWITDGVTMNFTTVDATTARLQTAVMFGGADLLYANGTFEASGADAGTIDVDTGWADDQAPDIVMFFTHAGLFDSTFYSQETSSYGLAHNGGSITQRVKLRRDNNGADPSALEAEILTTRVAGFLSSGALQWGLELTSFNAGATPGFTVTRRGTIAANIHVAWVALKFSDLESEIFDFDTPTSTGDAAISLTLEPQMLFIVQSMLTSTGSVATDGTAGSMGISVVLPHREACMAGWSEDAQATTDVGTITDTKAANIRPHDGTTTADLIATGPSGSGAFAAGSATLNFTDVDTGAAHKWFGFAVGAAGSGTGQGVSTAELDHETSASQMIKNIVVT